MKLRQRFERLKEKLGSKPKLSGAAKRNLLLATSLIVICTAVFLNLGISGGDGSIEGIVAANSQNGAESDSDGTSKVLGDSVEVSKTEPNFFAASVIDRERVRDAALETFRDVADSEHAAKEEKENALAKMNLLADQMQKEVNIENLVMAKGFEDCVAVVTEEGVDVIVKTVGLLPGEVARIKEIAVEQTGADVSEIRIIEHE